MSELHPTASESDEYWMRQAMAVAREAPACDEIPVGAIVVKNRTCIARAHDLRHREKDPTAHAEILALRKAAEKTGDWRLEDCDLYVTLEPCPMCAGAIILSRIKRLIYGAPNHKSGAIETNCRLLDIETFNHKVEVTAGILAEESAALLKEFFKNKR